MKCSSCVPDKQPKFSTWARSTGVSILKGAGRMMGNIGQSAGKSFMF